MKGEQEITMLLMEDESFMQEKVVNSITYQKIAMRLDTHKRKYVMSEFPLRAISDVCANAIRESSQRTNFQRKKKPSRY